MTNQNNLAEQLRNWTDKSLEDYCFVTSIAEDELDIQGDSLMERDRVFFHHLADEIDRLYIPRPILEDGRPMQWDDGKDIDWINLVDIDYAMRWGITAIDDKGRPLATGFKNIVAMAKMTKDGLVKLKNNNPILDADGVELKVGDIPYSKRYGTKRGPIKSVHHAGEVNPFNNITINSDFVCYEPYESMFGISENGWDYAHNLVHGQDSLEKLRDDIAAYSVQSPNATDDIFEWRDRLTAIIERNA